MEKQYYTVVVFSEAGKPRKIQLPKHLARVAIIFCLALGTAIAGSLYYFSSGFVRLSADTAELTELRRETKLQKIQVEKFSQQIKDFESEMSRLAGFEKKMRVITAQEDSPKSLEKSWGVGGPYGLASHSFVTSLERETAAMVNRLSANLGQLTNQAKLQAISFQELDEFVKNQNSYLSAVPTIRPTKGWVTSKFGYRMSPFTVTREKHDGLDIAAQVGTPVRAPADGKVIKAGRENGYGNMLEIDHGYGFMTRYGHNSKHLVKVGDVVKRGQVVALVGNTGRSTGPHLHYEIMFNNLLVDPEKYILEDE